MTARAFVTGVAMALCALPFYASVVPPMTDVSQHVLVARIIAAYHVPALRYPEFFAIEWTLAPGSAFYALLAAIQSVVGPFWDARLYLTLWVALTWSAAWCLARVRGHPEPWLAALLTLPLSFCWYVYMGLLPFLMTLPLFAFAMAVWWSRWGPYLKTVVLWVLLATLFGFHVVGAAATAAAVCVAAVVNVLLDKGAPRQLLWAGVSVLPVPILVGAYMMGKTTPAAHVQHSGWISGAVDIVKYTCATLSDQASMLMLVWVALLTLAAAIRWRDLVAERPVALAAAALVVIAVAVPVNMGALWPAGPRLFPFALVLLIPCVNWGRFRGNVVAGTGLALLAGLSAFTTQKAQALDREFRDFLSAVEVVQRGRRFLPILVDPHAGSRWVDPFWSLGSAYTVLRGGYNPYVFAIPYVKTGASPLRYRTHGEPGFAFLYDHDRTAEDYRGVSRAYDYVLLWGDAHALETTLAAEMTLISVHGQGKLFARIQLTDADRGLGKLSLSNDSPVPSRTP